MSKIIEGQCHCGKVKWKFEGDIDRITACNCTVCRKYGTLWAYGFKDKNVTISGETSKYLRSGEELSFNFCSDCGCVAYWHGVEKHEEGYRVAVNTRLANNPEEIESIPIRHFDGLGKFSEDPDDGRCVKDMWY